MFNPELSLLNSFYFPAFLNEILKPFLLPFVVLLSHVDEALGGIISWEKNLEGQLS